MASAANPPEADSIAAATSRVQNVSVPDWVEEIACDKDFKSSIEAPVTCLLFDTQIHAERHEMFVHNVFRLETREAVQHWSQWRLQFQPTTQFVKLHFLKIWRGDVEIDQSNIEKAHFLQREEGLERFVIHGWFTMLMVLEDVRPGDILDFSYTIESQNSIFPNHGGHFFTLPHAVSTGRYHFAARFAPSRQRKWKSSSADLTPTESTKDGLTFWDWRGENYAGQKPEANSPSWHVSYQWIQVSDFPDWQMIASELSRIWEAENDAETIAKMASEIESAEVDLASRIGKAVQFVQDECRYLSVNLELGGQVPASPETVVRRRFGDCKDLSFLLANVLKKLGVRARPVLVNTFLRKSVGAFLPMPSLFNHVIVEFEADGKKRWLDTTFKEQGGNPFNRFVPNYGFGLPIAPEATGLAEQPEFEQPSLFDLSEHILLDTTNGLSLVEVTVRAKGNQADILRFQAKKSGVEEWARQRLKAAINRFGNATRIGAIQYRDDRAANSFILTEVFEIKFILGSHSNPKSCRFNLPAHWLGHVLAMPEKKERIAPFNLPSPCRIHYVAKVECNAIQRMHLSEPYIEIEDAFARLTRRNQSDNGYILTEYSLTTKAEFVPAEEVEKHRETVEKILAACCRELTTARGYPRPALKPGFGQLPPTMEEPAVKPPPIPSQQPPPLPVPHRRHRYRRSSRSTRKTLFWILGAIGAAIVILTVLKLLAPQ